MDEHVDLYYCDYHSMSLVFKCRLPLDDPLVMKDDGNPTQIKEGWATYYQVSEPHTLEDCPHADK